MKFFVQEFRLADDRDPEGVLAVATVRVEVEEFDDPPKVTEFDKSRGERGESVNAALIVTPCKIRTVARVRKGDERGAFVEFGNLRLPGSQKLSAELVGRWEDAKVAAAAKAGA